MGGSIDVAVAVARGLVFAAALQAAGAALFRATIGPFRENVEARVRRLIIAASLVTIVAVLARSVLEPARMAGALSGVSDPFLWSLLWQSDVAVAQASRIAGAVILLAAACGAGRLARLGRWIGIGLIVISFATMGHTRSHSGPWLLGALLTLHIGIAAFWFGALWPLLIVLRHSARDEATRLFGLFSTLAVRAVPALFAAGLLLAVLLIGSIEGLTSRYGRLVLLKFVLFAVLLGLAAANRYRWVPRLAAHADSTPLRRSIVAETVLMLGVLGATAAMTTLYSPD